MDQRYITIIIPSLYFSGQVVLSEVSDVNYIDFLRRIENIFSHEEMNSLFPRVTGYVAQYSEPIMGQMFPNGCLITFHTEDVNMSPMDLFQALTILEEPALNRLFEAIPVLRSRYEPVPEMQSVTRYLTTEQFQNACKTSDKLIDECMKDNKCAVCQEYLHSTEFSKEIVTINKCSHVFHKDCIVPWLSKNITCPLCRIEIADEGNYSIDKHDDEVPRSTHESSDRVLHQRRLERYYFGHQ